MPDIELTKKSDYDAHVAALVTGAGGIHGLGIEEGSWTPGVTGADVAGSHTYVAQSGSYLKIGKLVIASFRIELSAKDAAMSGFAYITGLPFAARGGLFRAGASFGAVNGVNLGTGYTQIAGLLANGGVLISVQELGDNIDSHYVQASQIGNTAWFNGTITYYTA